MQKAHDLLLDHDKMINKHAMKIQNPDELIKTLFSKVKDPARLLKEILAKRFEETTDEVKTGLMGKVAEILDDGPLRQIIRSRNK